MEVNGIKLAGTLRPLVNSRSLQLECAKVLHEALLMVVLLYGRRRRGLGLGLKMDNLKGLWGIRR